MTAARFGPYLPTLAGGPAAADAVLAAGATAVVAHNDMLAIGVMLRLAERGVAVPGEVSVVGFDDIFGADFCSPTLTTLAERTEDAGARAVEALVQQAHARAARPGRPGAADAARRAPLLGPAPEPEWRPGMGPCRLCAARCGADHSPRGARTPRRGAHRTHGLTEGPRAEHPSPDWHGSTAAGGDPVTPVTSKECT